MIRRRLKNLKRGDILYHKLPYGNYLICGKITNIKMRKNYWAESVADVRYKVFKGIDTYSTTRYDNWRVYREVNFEKTATIVEGDELDLLMLGK